LLVVQRAFGLPLVPHPTEDRARMETNTEANEEGNQRNDDAGGAIASYVLT
jgi:hypothetical protein